MQYPWPHPPLKELRHNVMVIWIPLKYFIIVAGDSQFLTLMHRFYTWRSLLPRNKRTVWCETETPWCSFIFCFSSLLKKVRGEVWGLRKRIPKPKIHKWWFYYSSSSPPSSPPSEVRTIADLWYPRFPNRDFFFIFSKIQKMSNLTSWLLWYVFKTSR